MFQTLDELDSLKATDWFSQVGETVGELSGFVTVRGVESWEDALQFAESEIAQWCRIEAGNLLSDSVRQHAADRFSQWNDIATRNLPVIDSIIDSISLTPGAQPFERSILDHTRSLLVGAALELAYADCTDIRVMTHLIAPIQQGRFPCGIEVVQPNDFPSNAAVVVY